MELIDRFEPELIVLDLAKDQHFFGGKLKEKDINTRRRKLQFTYDGQIIDLTNTTCIAYIVNSNGEISYVPCTINGEYALLDFTTSNRSAEGELIVEVKLSYSEYEVSTFTIEFEVVKSLRNDRAIQSSNEFSALQDMINSLGGIGDVPKDLRLTASNTLHLIDARGNKVGAGVNLPDLSIGGNVDFSEICIVCDEKQDGDTSDSERIQRAIDSSNEGDIIKFPNGILTIDKTIVLKPNRTYIGGGWGSCITAADNANLAEMISLPHSTNNYRTMIKDIRLHGNKDNDGSSTGLYIGSIVHGIIQNVYVTYCKGTGLYIDGDNSFRSNTTDLINCRAFGCDRYGLYISEYCEDMHVLQGDYGSNGLDGVHLKSPSSSIRDITCWGNMTNGVTIDSNAVGCQLWNSQIEGNAEIGVFLNASYCYICSNKIYDNANIPANYGKYDGIYVNAYDAYKDAPIEGVSIIGNKVYSGLYQNTGRHRYALAIDKYHKNFSIFGNDFFYQGNGSLTNAGNRVYGLNETDKSDRNWINSFANITMSADQAAAAYESVKVKFDTAVTDVDSNYSDGKLVIKDPAYYRLNCNIHVDNATSGSYNTLEFYVNGECKSRVAGAYGGTANFLTLSGSDTFYLGLGDTIEVYFRSTADVSINSAAYLSTLTLTKV